MTAESNQYMPPSSEEKHRNLVNAFSDSETSEESKKGGTESQIAEAEEVKAEVFKSNQWSADSDFTDRVSAITELAKTDYAAYEKGINELSTWFIGADAVLKAPALRQEKAVIEAVQLLAADKVQGVQAIRKLNEESQVNAAKQFFMEEIGDTEVPTSDSLERPYEVYLELKGTPFAATFAELEDARLRKYKGQAFIL